MDLFVAAIDNEVVQYEDEAATKRHQAYTDFVKYKFPEYISKFRYIRVFDYFFAIIASLNIFMMN